MSSERSRQALVDMLDNVTLALEFVAGMSRADFMADRRTFYATTRCLEIISEAARRLDPLVEMRHPHLPWHAIRAAGNHYRHEYDNVAEVFVWNTVANSLPELKRLLMQELEQPYGASAVGARTQAEEPTPAAAGVVAIEVELPTHLLEFAVSRGIDLSAVACKLIEAEIERSKRAAALCPSEAD